MPAAGNRAVADRPKVRALRVVAEPAPSPADLTALEASERLARGELSAVALTEACLQRIGEREPQIGAFSFVDEELALAQARQADAQRGSGRPLGPLHGLPVGIKDIIDTADMPTENGAALDAGRRPRRDATVVARLRAAGAVILGKTVTTELAYRRPGATRNPRDPCRTPGGSSSGSAAAVASTMLPFAVGTQTGGSVIRPAAFCGVVGFKPTFGLLPRTGVLRHSRWLDTVGTFGRTVEDAALLADAMAGHDPADPDTRSAAAPEILRIARTQPPVTPTLGFVKTPSWGEVEPDCADAFAELVAVLGGQCDEVKLPPIFEAGVAAQRRLAVVGMARHLCHYYDRGRERLGEPTREAIEEGRAVVAVDYLAALDMRDALYAALEEIFTRYDALITPAAPGQAPVGLDHTGSHAFCVLWTLTGVPAVTLPLLEGVDGMPVGVQAVGARGEDGRLLRTARWLTRTLAGVC